MWAIDGVPRVRVPASPAGLTNGLTDTGPAFVALATFTGRVSTFRVRGLGEAWTLLDDAWVGGEGEGLVGVRSMV